MMLKIQSVNISEEKGTIKFPVDAIEIDKNGIKNDAHSGSWHRQVSILGSESIERFSLQLKRPLIPGEFAENITLEGFSVKDVKVSDRLICGDVELEITQIGKQCHGNKCAIFTETGDCIMPREGIFCRAIKGGMLKPGDIMNHIRQ